jgi:hypothetical protein
MTLSASGRQTRHATRASLDPASLLDTGDYYGMGHTGTA